MLVRCALGWRDRSRAGTEVNRTIRCSAPVVDFTEVLRSFVMFRVAGSVSYCVMSVLELSRRQNSMKCFREDNRVKMWRFSDVSGANSLPTYRVCWWFGSTKTDNWVLVLPNHQQMGTELAPETSGNLHILMRLSDRENFIDLLSCLFVCLFVRFVGSLVELHGWFLCRLMVIELVDLLFGCLVYCVV